MSWPLHNSFQLRLGSNIFRISSDFDSGNLENAYVTASGEVLLATKQIEVQPGLDCANQQTSVKPSSKAFFHFKVTVEEACKLHFRVNRVKILKHLYEDDQSDKYRLCIRRKREKQYSRYEKLPKLEMQANEQLQLTFSYAFQERDEVYFALSYPYSYTRMIELVRRLDEEHRNDPEIYLQKEVLTYSIEGKLVPMLTISSHDGKTSVPEERISNALFPQSILSSRPFKFKKPVVLVTCRIHPGETPSSYALEGFLEFLLNRRDARACLLRKMFSFIVVPMMNPDGVYKGMYRMDSLGQNLNRFYNNAQSHKQYDRRLFSPSVLAVRSLFCYYEREAKMHAYFDMHAHSRLAGWFLYGNACQEFVQQVEIKLFARLMSINSSQFCEDLCNFSQAQMTFKDSNENMTKEGCGRVVAYRTTGIVHSYTLELGFHTCEKRQLPAQSNVGAKYQNGEYVQYEQPPDGLFVQASYREAGRALLISLLDIMELNPYSRVSDKEKDISEQRQLVAKQIYEKEERFKLMDPGLIRKLKNINQLTRQSQQTEMLLRFRSVNRDSIMKSTSLTPSERHEEDTKGATSPTDGKGSVTSRQLNQDPNDVKFESRQLIKNTRLPQKKTRVTKAASSLSKEVVVINQPSQREEAEYRIIKPLRIDFEPFPRFERREIEAFVRKHTSFNAYHAEELLKHRELINLPTINRMNEASPVRRRPSNQQSTGMPFSVELRLRRSFQVKYGIRQSFPEEELTAT